MTARLFVVFLFLATPTFAGDAYFVSRNGSDGNTGLDWTNAWATSNKAFTTIGAGDTVIWGEGAFYSSHAQNQQKSPTTTPTVYACSSWYADRGDPASQDAGRYNGASYRTKLLAGDSLNTWDCVDSSGGNWVWRCHAAFSAGIWGITTPYYCTQGGNGAVVDSHLLVQYSTTRTSVDQEGEAYYNGTVDSMYIWPWGGRVDPNTLIFTTGVWPVYTFGDGSGNTRSSNVLFYGLEMVGGTRATLMWWEEADSVKVERCKLWIAAADEWSNGSVVSCDLINGGCQSAKSEYCQFLKCEIGSGGSAWAGNYTGGDPYTAITHTQGGCTTIYDMDKSVFDSCTFTGPSYFAVHFKNDNHSLCTSNTPFTGNVMRFCTVRGDVGGIDVGFSILTYPDRDSCYGNIFKEIGSTVILMDQNPYQSDGASYLYQTFIGNNTAIAPTNRPGQIVSMFSDNGASSCGSKASKMIGNVWDGYDPSGCGYGTFVVQQADEGGCETTWVEIDYNIWHDASAAFEYEENSTRCPGHNWSYWTGTAGYDANGANADPDFDDPNDADLWVGLARSSAADEMSETYGGKTWTVAGAVQPTEESETPPVLPTLGKVKHKRN